MSETDMIRGFVKNILKPIIAEAIAEVGAETAQRSEKRYYTREEACRHLKIGTTTFYRLAKKGKINILKIEGKTLVDADELDEAIETRQVFRYQH
ncbi:MAG: helix-turn-helix domain-containing protein [Bacteroidales bacterium]|nr:helix-turn-helix domain-containing protein [Bacteroidales bacterium]